MSVCGFHIFPFNAFILANSSLITPSILELEDAVLQQPAFFITGTLDPVNFFIPSSEPLIERIGKNYKNLLFAEELEGIGHWTQQEAPEEVNSALLRFLEEVS